jgi:hypothetical protein
VGVEIHRECFEIFFYGKLQTCQVPLIKGMILCEELSLNSRGKGTSIVRPNLSHAAGIIAILVSMLTHTCWNC